jgi:hypothetical protein
MDISNIITDCAAGAQKQAPTAQNSAKLRKLK